MDEKKVGKYLNKVLLCKDNCKLKVYNNKLNTYYKNIQYGGSYDDLNTLLDAYLGDIVKGNYRLLTDQQFFIKNWKTCSTATDFFSEDTEKSAYGFNLNYYCFARKLSEPNDFDLVQNAYKFKKNFSLDLTEFYVNDAVTPEDNSKIVNFIHFSLEYGIKSYIEKVINDKIFGAKSDSIIDKIIVLYKGGNTTRMFINNFINTIMPKLRDTVTGNKAREIGTKIKSEYKIGDWDFQINIKYEELEASGFDNNDIAVVLKHVTQVIAITLTYLKSQTELLFKSKKNIERFARKIQSAYFNDNMTRYIDSNIPMLNQVNDRKFDIFKLIRIYTFDKVIEPDRIINLTDDKILNKKSFVFFNVPNSNFNIGDQTYTNNTLVQVDKFQISDVMNKYLPDYLVESPVYISLLKNLSLVRGMMPISDFHLYRCKINTVFEFDVKYSGDPLTTNKTKQFSIELIDVSITTPLDTRPAFSKLYVYDDFQPFTEINIKAPFGETLVTKIPSPHYMFVDLASMILGEALFIWEDAKYEKRIYRLIFIIVICLLSDGEIIQNIRYACATVHNLFTTLKSMNTIDQKLNFLAPHFDIIDDPNSNRLNNSMNKLLISPINFRHLLIKLKPTSVYKLKYFEQLIEKYIQMLIVAQYILFNKSNYYNYTQYRLLFFNLVDQRDRYISSNTIILTKGLSDIYKEIRGTPIKINVIPQGPIAIQGGLPAADPQKVTNMMELFNKFDNTLINLDQVLLTVLDGLIDAGVNQLNLQYNLETLF